MPSASVDRANATVDHALVGAHESNPDVDDANPVAGPTSAAVERASLGADETMPGPDAAPTAISQENAKVGRADVAVDAASAVVELAGADVD